MDGKHELRVKYGLLSVRIICLRCGNHWFPRGIEATYTILSVAMTALVSTYISNCWSIPMLEDMQAIMGNMSSLFLFPAAFPIMVILNLVHFALVKHTQTLEWWICSSHVTECQCERAEK